MASSSKSKSVKKTSKTSCNYKNAFNKSLVGTVDAIRVQPNILRVDPTRYREEKLIFYITNLSDVPQHLNVLRFGQPGSLTALNSVKLLEPGKTATCVLQVCNLDFSKDANSRILVYHSRVKHKDITAQYQGNIC
ncbi:hypothetical protein M3Y94_00725700 [Aphelenchoides besseyi]|nr:hypothetical protein M3Y94_00725700 [Aphelenchoides besseyi]